MTVLRSSIASLTANKVLNAVLIASNPDFPDLWKDIFSINTSDKAFEEEVMVSGLGVAAVKAEGSSVAFDNINEAYTARYQMVTTALAFSCSEEAVEDDTYLKIIARSGRWLMRAFKESRNIRGADVLNNGFSSGVTYGDGVSLLNTAHPLFSGGTFSNKLATPADLSEESLEAIAIQAANFTDERGIRQMIKLKKLIVPTALGFEAQRILYSDLRVGTSDNDLNAIKSLGTVPGGFSVNNFLTDPDAWFVTTNAEDGLKYFSRKPPQVMSEGDFNTGNMKFKIRGRDAFGATDPRGILGSEGA